MLRVIGQKGIILWLFGPYQMMKENSETPTNFVELRVESDDLDKNKAKTGKMQSQSEKITTLRNSEKSEAKGKIFWIRTTEI